MGDPLPSRNRRDLPVCGFAVDRITVGPHRWGILHLEKDTSFMKVLLEADPFTKAEELMTCVGLVLCVLVYTGWNAYGKLACRILIYDTVAGRVNDQ